MALTPEELDFMLELGEDGIDRHKGPNAIENNIKHWCMVAQGTVPDWPSWGNNFHQLKFLPQKEFEAVAEMMILRKMRQDIWGFIGRGIRIEVAEIDLFKIYVDYGYGQVIEQEIRQ